MVNQRMVQARSFKRLICVWVALLHLVFSTVLVVGPVHAQATSDDEPPVVDLQVVETGNVGDNQVFSATVTDNQAVSEVVLYYRVAGAGNYQNVPMELIPGTSIYTVTIDVLTDEATVIEYYINASDTSNNRVVRGFAFDPLTRDLTAADNLASTAETPVPQAPVDTAAEPISTGLTTGQKVLYGALGILAVGALAAAASGGGGSSSGSGGTNPGGGPTIPVIITADPVGTEFD